MYSTLLHLTAQQYTMMNWTAHHCTRLYITLLHCTQLYFTLLHCTRLYFTLLHCTQLYFTAVHSSSLHCTTSSHLKSFLEPAVPPIRLFLMINMMPLKRCVVNGNYFTALFRNEARNKFLRSGPWLSVANSGRCHLLPLDGAVYIFYSNLVMSNFPEKVGMN